MYTVCVAHFMVYFTTVLFSEDVFFSINKTSYISGFALASIYGY